MTDDQADRVVGIEEVRGRPCELNPWPVERQLAAWSIEFCE